LRRELACVGCTLHLRACSLDQRFCLSSQQRALGLLNTPAAVAGLKTGRPLESVSAVLFAVGALSAGSEVEKGIGVGDLCHAGGALRPGRGEHHAMAFQLDQSAGVEVKPELALVARLLLPVGIHLWLCAGLRHGRRVDERRCWLWLRGDQLDPGLVGEQHESAFFALVGREGAVFILKGAPLVDALMAVEASEEAHFVVAANSWS